MSDIRIKIVQDGKFWYGEAYIDKTDSVTGNTYKEWKRVTSACTTINGAKYEAERWKALYEGAFF